MSTAASSSSSSARRSSSSRSCSSSSCSTSGSCARSSPTCRTGSAPTRAGPFGVLQSLADGIKLFFKEQSVPDPADSFVFKLAPVPLGAPRVPRVLDRAHRGRGLDRRPPDVPAARRSRRSACCSCSRCPGIGLYGVMLAGWSSGSKYPLLGSVRASAQLISYEAAFGLAIVGVLLYSGTLSTRGIVNGAGLDELGLVRDPVVLVAGDRRVRHLPRSPRSRRRTTRRSTSSRRSRSWSAASTPSTPASGSRIFFLAEFMNLITMSAIAVTLFLGGPSGPAPRASCPRTGTVNVWIMPIFWFFLKLVVLLYGTVWVRASLAPPALRPAHGPRVEVAHRARVPLGHGLRA